MSRPLRIEYEDAFYHIIQRGIERKNIFISDTDRFKFLSYLDQAYNAYGAIFHAYTLMDNHYHIILQTPRANLSKIMHFLNTSYAAYFNTKRKRVGPLYQGRYKAILVQEDEYLHYLTRYIHLNPVRIKIVKDPIEYPWSSYKHFTSSIKPPRYLNISFTLSMFDKNNSKAKSLYKKFVIDGIGKEKAIIDENMISNMVLGDNDFLEAIEERLEAREDYEVPGLNRLKRRNEPPLDSIKQLVCKNTSDNPKLQRKLAIYLSRKFTQKTLKQIADFYGNIKYTGVSQIIIRTEKARGEDSHLDKRLKTIEESISVECVDLTL